MPYVKDSTAMRALWQKTVALKETWRRRYELLFRRSASIQQRLKAAERYINWLEKNMSIVPSKASRFTKARAKWKSAKRVQKAALGRVG
jgi:hypothetical protein